MSVIYAPKQSCESSLYIVLQSFFVFLWILCVLRLDTRCSVLKGQRSVVFSAFCFLLSLYLQALLGSAYTRRHSSRSTSITRIVVKCCSEKDFRNKFWLPAGERTHHWHRRSPLLRFGLGNPQAQIESVFRCWSPDAASHTGVDRCRDVVGLLLLYNSSRDSRE